MKNHIAAGPNSRCGLRNLSDPGLMSSSSCINNGLLIFRGTSFHPKGPWSNLMGGKNELKNRCEKYKVLELLWSTRMLVVGIAPAQSCSSAWIKCILNFFSLHNVNMNFFIQNEDINLDLQKLTYAVNVKSILYGVLRWTFSNDKSVLFWHKWTISAPGIIINNPKCTLMRRTSINL